VIDSLIDILERFFFFFRKPQPDPEDGAECSDDYCVVSPPFVLPDSETNQTGNPDTGDHVRKYHHLILPGHNPGIKYKSSPLLPSGERVMEWEINEKTALDLADRLDELGVRNSVYPSRESDYEDLRERAEWCNSKAWMSHLPCIVWSIHHNAAAGNGWSMANGVEVWHHPTSQAGAHIAGLAAWCMHEATGRKNRGVKHAKRGQTPFYVLRKTTSPAVLVECEFFTYKEAAYRMIHDQAAFVAENVQGLTDAILHIEKQGIPGYPGGHKQIIV